MPDAAGNPAIQLTNEWSHRIGGVRDPPGDGRSKAFASYGRCYRVGADWEEDMRRGLTVIGSRAGALRRFLEGYALLARLPPPRFSSTSAVAVVRRAAALETRLAVRIVEGKDVTLRADADQLEQLLINLLRNAVDATLATGGSVSIGWDVVKGKGEVEIWVEDEGEGLSETANLFVPFFTTKPQGSGIGLVLSRQIAEAHGGRLRIESRDGASGCRASVLLPLPVAERSGGDRMF